MARTDPKTLFDNVLSRAIAEIRVRGIDVFTFAFYHDHESAAVSICVDTAANSARSVREQNSFNMEQFTGAVTRGDLHTASLFNANVGRSLELGDFEMVNVARTDFGGMHVNVDFYLKMISAVRAREHQIALMAHDVERLLFCSSSAEWEVGYMWTASPTAAKP